MPADRSLSARETSLQIPDDVGIWTRAFPWLWLALAMLAIVAKSVHPVPQDAVLIGTCLVMSSLAQLRLDHGRTQLLLLHVYEQARRP